MHRWLYQFLLLGFDEGVQRIARNETKRTKSMTGQQGRDVITLTEAASMIGRNYGHKPSVATVWRWAKKGLSGYRLATIRIGRRYRTTTTAVREFVERLSEGGHKPVDRQAAERIPTDTFTKAEIAEAHRQQDREVAEAKKRLRQYASSPNGGRRHGYRGTSTQIGGA